MHLCERELLSYSSRDFAPVQQVYKLKSSLKTWVTFYWAVYRSPSGAENNFNNLCESIVNASHTRYNLTCITVDFNIKGIDRVDMRSTKGPNALSAKFLRNVHDNFMY